MMSFCWALQRGVTGRTEGLSCLEKVVVYDLLHKQEVGMKVTVKAHHVPLAYLSMRVVHAGE